MTILDGEQIKELDIDIETYSSVNLDQCGAYKYTEDESFEILLFSYAVNGGQVRQVDLTAGEQIPEAVLRALSDETVTKWAFNCNFERIGLSNYIKRHCPQYFKPDKEGYLKPRSWHCSMVSSAYVGLPQSLAKAGEVMRLDKEKLEEGKEDIRYFCQPCKPTKANGGRHRNLPEHDPDRWTEFKKYNIRDVEVEMELREKEAMFQVPESVWEQFYLDQCINDRGIQIDTQLVQKAIAMEEQASADVMEKLKRLTDLENPRSVSQMKGWLSEKGMEMESLSKDAVAQALQTAPDQIKEVLTLYQQISKSSISKYGRMAEAVCSDGRARGMFRFYGAGRTGRFSGKIIQLQNLPRNHISDLDEARELVKSGDYEALCARYDNVQDILSQLIRTALIPGEGKQFFIADFSSIEARVLACMAGEKWRMQAFHDGEDIYCRSASAMFGKPVEKGGINGELRQKGKIAELACGYGGSVGAMEKMGALEAGLKEEELKPIVDAWRRASPHIVHFWWDIDRAIKQVIKNGGVERVKNLKFRRQNGMLIITLPSGRELFYARPRITENKFGGESITYEGNDSGKWQRIESYGPKFVENIIQGISRDILCYAMQTLHQYDIVAHVHDEIIIEAPDGTSLDEICDIMGHTPPWAEGLELRADGFVSEYYKKDD